MRTLEELACESISNNKARWPFRTRPDAREIAVDVLPTPPFCDAIAMTIAVNVRKARNTGILVPFMSLSTLEENSMDVNMVLLCLLGHRMGSNEKGKAKTRLSCDVLRQEHNEPGGNNGVTLYERRVY